MPSLAFNPVIAVEVRKVDGADVSKVTSWLSVVTPKNVAAPEGTVIAAQATKNSMERIMA